jgi:hypothetical protein
VPVTGCGWTRPYDSGRQVEAGDPYGEVAFLPGLPLDDDVQGVWLDDLEDRFANVARRPGLGAVVLHPRGRQLGPQKSWLLQFQVLFRTMFYNIIITIFFRNTEQIRVLIYIYMIIYLYKYLYLHPIPINTFKRLS